MDMRLFSCWSHNPFTRSAHLSLGAWPTRITTIMRTISLKASPQGARLARSRRAPWSCSPPASSWGRSRSGLWEWWSHRSTRRPSARSSCDRPIRATAQAMAPTAAVTAPNAGADRGAGSASGPAGPRTRRSLRPAGRRAWSPVRRLRRRGPGRPRRGRPRDRGPSHDPSRLPRPRRRRSPLPRHPRPRPRTTMPTVTPTPMTLTVWAGPASSTTTWTDATG
jgi:hypothetical protein